MYNVFMNFNFFKLQTKISFNHVGIVYNSKVECALGYANLIKEIFDKKKIVSEVVTTNELKNTFSFVIVIGGDGSILKTGRFCTQNAIPFFGFNVGRVGFLAQADAQEFKSIIDKLLSHNYKIDKRMLICEKNKKL